MKAGPGAGAGLFLCPETRVIRPKSGRLSYFCAPRHVRAPRSLSLSSDHSPAPERTALSRYRKIPVVELEVGMYVSELDRPWLETPFLFQGFYVSNDAELAADGIDPAEYYLN